MEWLIGGLIAVLVLGFIAIERMLGQIAKQLHQGNVTLAMMLDDSRARVPADQISN